MAEASAPMPTGVSRWGDAAARIRSDSNQRRTPLRMSPATSARLRLWDSVGRLNASALYFLPPPLTHGDSCHCPPAQCEPTCPSLTHRTPVEFLSAIKGKAVLVRLNSGVDYRGEVTRGHACMHACIDRSR